MNLIFHRRVGRLTSPFLRKETVGKQMNSVSRFSGMIMGYK